MEHRLHSLRIALFVAFAALVLRLLQLQVIQGGRYRALAEQNRLRLVPEQAPRGLIVDRRGRILATNQTMFRVAIVPQEVEDLRSVVAQVSTLVHRSPDALERAFSHERGLAFMPATIVSHVPKDVAIRLEEERWRLPGLLVKPETVRHYPLGSSAAHLLGYLNQPTPEEFPLLKQYGVRAKQLVGRDGLERLLDHALQGRSGGLLVEVNHRARLVRVVGRRRSCENWSRWRA
jgi:penicillin-binding protein 2